MKRRASACCANGLIAGICGLLAACGSDGSGADTPNQSDLLGLAGGSRIGSNGVASVQDFGLVVRTWLIDDARGTTRTIEIDPNSAEANKDNAAGQAAQAGPTSPSDDEAPQRSRGATSDRPTPPRSSSDKANPNPKASNQDPANQKRYLLKPDWRAAIAAVAVAPPIEPTTVELWRTNGIELIGVPMERLSSLEAILLASGSRQDQQMRETTDWTEVCRGPDWRGSRTLALDNGPVTLSSGRMRLLMRTWLVPGANMAQQVQLDRQEATDFDTSRESAQRVSLSRDESVGAAVRVEVMPQHLEGSVQRGKSLEELLKGDTNEPGIEREGLLFRRLTMIGTLSGEVALVVVARDAGLEPIGGNDGAEQGASGGWMAQQPDRSSANGNSNGMGGVGFQGPRPSTSMRLGPSVLTDAYGDSATTIKAVPKGATGVVGDPTTTRRWIVLVFVPRAPDRYELLGN